MKKVYLTVLGIIILGSSVCAQNSLEFGIGNGWSTYLGDLQTKYFTYNQSNIAMGGMFRYNWDGHKALRVFANYGKIEGDDARSSDPGHIARNLNFESNIFEIGLVGEYNILNFGHHPRAKSCCKGKKFTPYLFGGIAIFNFNPRTYYNGRWVNLNPLGTEGQGIAFSSADRYRLTQIAIPFGLGVKAQLNKRVYLGFELGWRKTFTDYLDDVSGNYYSKSDLQTYNGDLSAELSFRGDELPYWDGLDPVAGSQRGNSSNLDWYLMNQFTFSYRIFSEGKR